MRTYIAVATVLMTMILGQCGSCAVIRVSTAGQDTATNDGSTWELAKRTIGAAIGAATAGDEVWVAAGTYTERITLEDGIALKGGYTGTGDARDPGAYVTTVDGSQSGTVVTAKNVGSTCVIDGFTITNGKASIGPGILVMTASPTITNNVITGNVGGGAIACGFGSDPLIENNTITRNEGKSGYGGGIYVYKSSPQILGNTISHNSSPYRAGGIHCDTDCSPLIKNNSIVGNGGGGVSSVATCSPQIEGNSIIGNVAASGGGISLAGTGSPVVIRNTIAGNICHYIGNRDGGGIYCAVSGSPVIRCNYIVGNGAGYHTGSGGGIWISGSALAVVDSNVIGGNGAAEYGGGIWCTGSCRLINNTVTGNSAYEGGGVYICYMSTPGSSPAPTFVNNIVAHNSSGIAALEAAPVFRNNNVWGNERYAFDGLPDPTGSDGNISADPLIVDWLYGNVRLATGSPCRDTGDTDSVEAGVTDIAGDPRVSGAGVDMGAFETDGVAATPGPYAMIRVSPAGDDKNDGSSWQQAKRTIQAAIEAASAAGGEVWVAAGTYRENAELRPYAYLYGGFSGTEDRREQRNWRANASIIDAGGAGSVVTCIIGGPLTCIDGFTIRNGSGRIAAGDECDGGGLFLQHGSPTVSNNIIEDNIVDVGGVYGGGLYITDGCTALITGCTIRGNVAGRSRIGMGGGIFSDWPACPIVRSNLIVGNSVNGYGGGVCAGIGAGEGRNGMELAGNTIVGNTASSIGGVYAYSRRVRVYDNIIAFNSSGIYGPGSFGNNDVYGNASGDYLQATPSPGDISADPMFVNMAAGDYRLKPGSPCIDSGDNTWAPSTDIDGSIRPQDGNADGVAVCDMGAYEYPLSPFGARKSYADGSSVSLGGVIVTAVFPDSGCIYVEAPDRSAGIRVDTDKTFVVGDVVSVSGTVSTDATTGERFVAAGPLWPQRAWTGGLVRPLYMSSFSLAGGPAGLQEAVWSWRYVHEDSQPVLKWLASDGLNNIGLLVRVSGQVTQIDGEGGCFYVDDGSSVKDGTQTAGVDNVGIRVVGDGTLHSIGQHVVINGVSSCFKGEDGKLRRLLRPVSGSGISIQ